METGSLRFFKKLGPEISDQGVLFKAAKQQNRSCGFLPTFTKHQSVKPRPSTTTYPKHETDNAGEAGNRMRPHKIQDTRVTRDVRSVGMDACEPQLCSPTRGPCLHLIMLGSAPVFHAPLLAKPETMMLQNLDPEATPESPNPNPRSYTLLEGPK